MAYRQKKMPSQVVLGIVIFVAVLSALIAAGIAWKVGEEVEKEQRSKRFMEDLKKLREN